MATVNEAIYKLRFEGKEKIEQATAALNAHAVAEEKVTRATAATQSSLDRRLAQLDKRIAAEQQLQRRMAEAARYEQAGIGTAQQRAQFIDLATRRYNEQIAALNKVKGANDNLSRGIGLQRHEWVNLGRQMQDVGTMALMGQSPFMILTSQGAQVYDVLATSKGGIKGALKEVGSTMLGLITPARVLGLTFVGAAVTAGLAWKAFADQQKEMENSLRGIGRGAGLTVDQLNRIGEAAATQARVSTSAGRDIAAIFAGTGRIDSGMIPDLAGFSRRFGIQTGQDTTEAATMLAKAMVDPIRGAEELNQKLGGLTDRVREYIRRSVEAGDRTAAQKAIFETFNPAVAESERRMSALTRVWEHFAKVIGDAGDRLGRFFSGPADISGQISRLQAEIAAAEAQRAEARRRNPSLTQREPEGLGKLRDELAMLQNEQRHREWLADQDKRAIERADLTGRAGPLIRSLIPEIVERNRFADQRSLFGQLRGDPLAMKELGVTAEDVGKALERFDDRVKNLNTPLEKLVEQGKLTIDSINAVTLGERAAVAARRAEIEAINANLGPMERATSAQNAYNQVLAEAARQAREAVRESNNAAALIGLRPYQRRGLEIQQEYERNRERFGGVGAAGAPAAANVAAALGSIVEVGRWLQSQGLRVSEHPSFGGVGLMHRGLGHRQGRAIDVNVGRGVVEADVPEYDRRFRAIAEQLRGAGYTVIYGSGSHRGHMHVEVPAGGVRGRSPFVSGADIRGGVVPGGSAEQIRSNALRGRDDEFIARPLRDANEELDRQIKLQQASLGVWGASTAEITRAAEAQRLKNEYDRQGVELTPTLIAGIEDYARRAGEAAQQLENLQRVQRDMAMWSAEIGSALGEAFKGVVLEGRKASEVLDQLFKRLASRAIDQLFSMFFGGGSGPGGNSGGIFGAILGSLFKLPGSAYGNVFMGGRLVPFAYGGVVDGPTIFPMANGAGLMGERGPEAIMPLSRAPDGRLGVTAANQNRLPPKITLISNGAPVESAEIVRMTDDELMIVMDTKIARNNKTRSQTLEARASDKQMRRM